MVYVIAEPCVGTKDTACVKVCPVDCIHPTKDDADHAEETTLYISPEECIDCGACVPECPVAAIFPLDELPAKWNAYTELNAKYYELKKAGDLAGWKAYQDAHKDLLTPKGDKAHG
jgi:NAD-dependent dihydropyrimidine dehydrogenase PreA subunit